MPVARGKLRLKPYFQLDFLRPRPFGAGRPEQSEPAGPAAGHLRPDVVRGHLSVWRGAYGKGVFCGLIGGAILWFCALVLPAILPEGRLESLFSGSLWHSEALLGLTLDNPLTHGVVWSLGVNLLLSVGFSLRAEQSVIETLQASRFSELTWP